MTIKYFRAKFTFVITVVMVLELKLSTLLRIANICFDMCQNPQQSMRLKQPPPFMNVICQLPVETATRQSDSTSETKRVSVWVVAQQAVCVYICRSRLSAAAFWRLGPVSSLWFPLLCLNDTETSFSLHLFYFISGSSCPVAVHLIFISKTNSPFRKARPQTSSSFLILHSSIFSSITASFF